MRAEVTRFVMFACLLTGSAGIVAGATGPEQSPKAAEGLVGLMKSRQLSTVAATDPQNPGRVIAAMLIPDVQLLVVGAKSSASPYLESQIAQGQFAEVYAVLNSTAVPETKIFFTDGGGNPAELVAKTYKSANRIEGYVPANPATVAIVNVVAFDQIGGFDQLIGAYVYESSP